MGLACPLPRSCLWQNLYNATKYYASGTSEIFQSKIAFLDYFNNYKIAQFLFSIFFSPCYSYIHSRHSCFVLEHASTQPQLHDSHYRRWGLGVLNALQLAQRGYSRIRVLDAFRFPSLIAARNDVNKIVEGTYHRLNIV